MEAVITVSYGHADKLAAIVAGTQAAAGTFAKAMGVSKVAEMTREHDTRIWRVLEHHVHAARDRQDFSTVGKVGMDETSARKGQDYVSIFADMELGRVLFATEGRSADTVARFAADLAEHGGDPKKITDTNSDMSAAFISGIGEHLPNTGDSQNETGSNDRADALRGERRTSHEQPRRPGGRSGAELAALPHPRGDEAAVDEPLGHLRADPGRAVAVSLPGSCATDPGRGHRRVRGTARHRVRGRL